MIKELVRAFVTRSETLRLKGQKRDDAALEFFCGAAAALRIAGRAEDYEHVARVTGLVIAVGRYRAVERIAREDGAPDVEGSSTGEAK